MSECCRPDPSIHLTTPAVNDAGWSGAQAAPWASEMVMGKADLPIGVMVYISPSATDERGILQCCKGLGVRGHACLFADFFF